MRHIIKLTLLADFSSCIFMLIFLAITDSIGTALYFGVLAFGNILLPTLGAVCIYLLIKRFTNTTNTIVAKSLQSAILAVIFILGLFVWAAIDVALFEPLTFENIKRDYQSQFSGFLPIVFWQAIAIPIFDLWLLKRKTN